MRFASKLPSGRRKRGGGGAHFFCYVCVCVCVCVSERERERGGRTFLLLSGLRVGDRADRGTHEALGHVREGGRDEVGVRAVGQHLPRDR